MPSARLVLPVIAVAMAAAVPGLSPAQAASGSPAPLELIEIDAPGVLGVVREAGASAAVVNIWATWCTPCVEEFPALMRLHREYRGRGVKLILVSADFDTEIEHAREFLQAQGVDFVTYLKIGDDMEFIDGLDERWTGALPATFVYDRTGDLKHFWQGKATFEKLEKTVLEVLAASAVSEDLK